MTTLSDIEIKSALNNNSLISNYEKSQIGTACYELATSNVYYDLTESPDPITIKPKENIIIKPGHLVVLITEDSLDIPKNILGRIISKGSFFSIGLSPVSTVADPGFKGKIGLVTQNLSSKYIIIPIGEKIAKIHFEKLSSASEGYLGQHGFHTGIWPIKAAMQKEYSQIKNDPRVKEHLEEGLKILPPQVAEVINSIISFQKFTLLILAILFLINTLCLYGILNDWLTNSTSLIINIISSALMAILTYFKSNFQWKSKK